MRLSCIQLMASAEVSNLTFSSNNIIDNNSFCDNKIEIEKEIPSLLIAASAAASAEKNMFDDLENNDDSRGGESLEECGSLSDGADQDCSICRFVQTIFFFLFKIF